MIKEHMAHADIDHSPQPHAEKSTSNTQASRMPQGSARKITANFNPMVLSEIHAAGNKDQRVSLSPGGMRPTVPRQSSRSQCTAVQHRSTGVRTAYHVPMMYPVATMDWLYPLSGFVVPIQPPNGSRANYPRLSLGTRPRTTLFAIEIASTAPSLHAVCVRWASGTSPSHRLRLGRMASLNG